MRRLVAADRWVWIGPALLRGAFLEARPVGLDSFPGRAELEIFGPAAERPPVVACHARTKAQTHQPRQDALLPEHRVVREQDAESVDAQAQCLPKPQLPELLPVLREDVPLSARLEQPQDPRERLPEKMPPGRPQVQASVGQPELPLVRLRTQPLSQTKKARQALQPAVRLPDVLASISPRPWLLPRPLLAPRDPGNASARIRHARYRANSSASSFP